MRAGEAAGVAGLLVPVMADVGPLLASVFATPAGDARDPRAEAAATLSDYLGHFRRLLRTRPVVCQTHLAGPLAPADRCRLLARIAGPFRADERSRSRSSRAGAGRAVLRTADGLTLLVA